MIQVGWGTCFSNSGLTRATTGLHRPAPDTVSNFVSIQVQIFQGGENIHTRTHICIYIIHIYIYVHVVDRCELNITFSLKFEHVAGKRQFNFRADNPSFLKSQDVTSNSLKIYIASLKLTKHLNMDGWKTICFPFGKAISGAMFVSGGVISNSLNDSLFFDWCVWSRPAL